jgi:hypothetical protein
MEAHAEGLEGRSYPAEVLARDRPAKGSKTFKAHFISAARLAEPPIDILEATSSPETIIEEIFRWPF